MSFLSTIWDLIWLILTIFVFIAYLMALFSIITDLFRDRQLGGIFKAIWLIFLVSLPFLTALLYLIFRGKGMAERSYQQVAQTREATDNYIRSVTGPAGEINQAKQLLDSGAITEEEFTRLKKLALSQAD